MRVWGACVVLWAVAFALISADGESAAVSASEEPSSNAFEAGARRFCTAFEAGTEASDGQCPKYTAPKGKGGGLKLVRSMDPRATAAVEKLRTNREFQRWFKSKPEADVETATLLRTEAFRIFKHMDDRAKKIGANFNTVIAATFARARGLVYNRLSYSKAMTAYQVAVRGDVQRVIRKTKEMLEHFEKKSGSGVSFVEKIKTT